MIMRMYTPDYVDDCNQLVMNALTSFSICQWQHNRVSGATWCSEAFDVSEVNSGMMLCANGVVELIFTRMLTCFSAHIKYTRAYS